ncbi:MULTISPECIES: DUF4148 domain-containing protein [Delftia]|uniref:DUF4148 domain-containing protein n=2 Tax=Delftia TaxID=80865 RepID=A0A7T2VYC4_DELAC|nr:MULTISPECIES: DUF4148 domain-containing protein [Delftia]MBB1650500.1 hypothetical protein [Delftia sp. UME58]MBL8358282.1 DUF4148 domain-containing protein [Delftia acidovorans]QPS07555.1 DUF4148 domain-containing protein [Delftia acidovorans]
MSNTTPSPTAAAGALVLKSALAAIAFSTCFAAYSKPQDASTAPSGAALSRAEVIADLALWRRAGLDRHAEISISYGVETQEYRAAYQEYLRLRNSEAFQAEVRKALSR